MTWERVRESRADVPQHPLRHGEQQIAVRFLHSAKEPAKSFQHPGLFPRAAPSDIFDGYPLRKVKRFRSLRTIVEQLIQWNPQGSSQLLQGFD